jgi:hypothetical protein
MRAKALVHIVAVAMLTGCGADGADRADGEGSHGTVAAKSAPNAAGCGDAPQWRERAAETRVEALSSSRDQSRITSINRANFFSSMAIAADLQCIVPLQDGDPAIEAALHAAHAAERALRFYEQTLHWGVAHAAVNEAIERLVQRVEAALTAPAA